VLALALGATGMAAAPGGAATPVQKCAHLKGAVTLTPGISVTPHSQTASAKGALTTALVATITGKVSKGLFVGKQVASQIKIARSPVRTALRVTRSSTSPS
jgi:hypothetical protein